MSDYLSSRARSVKPFHVMDLLARAQEMQAQGREVLHLGAGEPDFATAQPIIDAGIAALQQQRTHYTAATGLPALRQAVADFYARKFGLSIDAHRIIITPGASGALQLALACLLDAGDEVLLSDPGYPCNRNIAELLAIKARALPVNAAQNYQLNAAQIEAEWGADTRAAMVSTPSNPTGTRLEADAMQALLAAVAHKQGVLIVDEIYQGLVYEVEDCTALQYSDDVFVINSFSKYFGMTGWRLGWMVVPDGFVTAIDRMAQNLFLAAPTPSQYAALAAFTPETETMLQQRRVEFQQRRDYLLPALQALGFKIANQPQGAFYIYANCSAITQDAFRWCHDLLEQSGVAVTPGIDFGDYQAEQHVRFAYTRPIVELQRAMQLITEFIQHSK